jgi:hypothetical protein
VENTSSQSKVDEDLLYAGNMELASEIIEFVHCSLMGAFVTIGLAFTR